MLSQLTQQAAEFPGHAPAFRHARAARVEVVLHDNLHRLSMMEGLQGAWPSVATRTITDFGDLAGGPRAGIPSTRVYARLRCSRGESVVSRSKTRRCDRL